MHAQHWRTRGESLAQPILTRCSPTTSEHAQPFPCPAKVGRLARFFRWLAPLLLAQCGNSTPPRPPETAPSLASVGSAAPPAESAHPADRRTGLPPTQRRPSATDYHGVHVSDDYAWLENPSDPDVKGWIASERTYLHRFLDGLPDRSAIHERVAELLASSSTAYFSVRRAGRRFFAIKDQPPKQQRFLVLLRAVDAPVSERTLVDPNEIDPSGGTTIDFFVPSLDGRRVAVSLSKRGSESGAVSVYDVASGKALGDIVPRVNGGTAGGSVAWSSDGNGFFYTRYPHDGERPAADLDFYQQIYFHKIGTDPSTDRYSLGKDFPRIAEIELETSESGRFTLARVANGDGGEFAFYVRGPEGKWADVSQFSDKAVHAQFGRDDSLYIISTAAKRGQVLRLVPATAPIAKARIVVPESEVVIDSIVPTATHLYVVDRIGGPSQIRVFPLPRSNGAAPDAARTAKVVPLLPVSSVEEIAALAGDALLFRNESYLEPQGWYRYDPATGKTVKTALFRTTIADMSNAEVTRDTCTSKDGTKVPISILRRKETKYDGGNITLLTGYGGYGINVSPRFRTIHRLWLDQGGIFAEANLRGGGEFGEEWHLAGNLTRKQNVFDDLYACAKLLVDSRATGPEHLAITGGSNGGLLMGAEIVQHPEMFRAVVSRVGIYDMLHVENTPNGAFNVTEFGTVKDPDQFRALYAYSPLHNVKDGVKYPSILFVTGANDPRVDPYNSRKMTARLRAATTSDNPILLRTSSETGHGQGKPLGAEVEELTDSYAFLLHELGVTFRP
jgi:prolyl oligopeptidase